MGLGAAFHLRALPMQPRGLGDGHGVATGPSPQLLEGQGWTLGSPPSLKQGRGGGWGPGGLRVLYNDCVSCLIFFPCCPFILCSLPLPSNHNALWQLHVSIHDWSVCPCQLPVRPPPPPPPPWISAPGCLLHRGTIAPPPTTPCAPPHLTITIQNPVGLGCFGSCNAAHPAFTPFSPGHVAC